ncbi:hypothetical protein [Janibacter limosus]|uniref:hypothetical protein n=1 Tax=Janibacter limosus TaxID=53458 RepID=UPI0008368D57|nr:hypothetical protein [Janibacter limosus]
MRTPRLLSSAVAVSALVLALTACGGADEPGDGASGTTVTVTTQATSSPAEPATGTSSAAGQPSQSAIPSANRLGQDTADASWVSPSGKIVCTLSTQGPEALARCDLRSGALPVPADLKDGCEFDMGASMVVDAQGARPGCVSDAVTAQSATQAQDAGWWTAELGSSAQDEAVLPYEHSVGTDQAECESRSTGMTCRVGDHGFTINDSSYTTW